MDSRERPKAASGPDERSEEGWVAVDRADGFLRCAEGAEPATFRSFFSIRLWMPIGICDALLIAEWCRAAGQ